MKSLEELKAIRDKAKLAVKERTDQEGYRIVVGMATCGIAAGARPVMTTLLDEVSSQKLENVIVTQTGCIGMCRLEPIVEVIDKEGVKFTYVKMTPERAKEIVEQHIAKGNPVNEYLVKDGE